MPRLPGMPGQSDFAYLAGLLDRGGMTAARSIGLKIVGPPELRSWLRGRFGGRVNGDTWWLTRQAELLIVLPRVEPFLKIRGEECRALAHLVMHARLRKDYQGDEVWRAERETLRGGVARARSDRAARGGG